TLSILAVKMSRQMTTPNFGTSGAPIGKLKKPSNRTCSSEYICSRFCYSKSNTKGARAQKRLNVGRRPVRVLPVVGQTRDRRHWIPRQFFSLKSQFPGT